MKKLFEFRKKIVIKRNFVTQRFYQTHASNYKKNKLKLQEYHDSQILIIKRVKNYYLSMKTWENEKQKKKNNSHLNSYRKIHNHNQLLTSSSISQLFLVVFLHIEKIVIKLNE